MGVVVFNTSADENVPEMTKAQITFADEVTY